MAPSSPRAESPANKKSTEPGEMVEVCRTAPSTVADSIIDSIHDTSNDVVAVDEEEIAYLRRSCEMLKADNRKLHEKAEHLESRLLFFVETNEEKHHRIEELEQQLSDARIRERELLKALEVCQPSRRSSIFGRKSRKNSMMSMSGVGSVESNGGMMHVSQSSPSFAIHHLNGHDHHHHNHHNLLHPHHGHSSTDDMASIMLSARASPDLSSVDGDSSIASYSRLGSGSGGSIGALTAGAASGSGAGSTTPNTGGASSELQHQDSSSTEATAADLTTESNGEKKKRRSMWMRITSGLPKIPGEFVV